jgi:anti-anti-sigma regulatory factor
MTIRRRPVNVIQLPERLSRREVQTFIRELGDCMNMSRPWLVLDCSNVRHLDKSVGHLLLHCLEEAIKRNGDVKLAGIPPAADAGLGFPGTNRLFEIFDTTADAVDSFYQLSFDRASDMDKSESAA